MLVTGVPRSGTTWLARELAAARGAALPGKEPMNPRAGQFALGGTLQSWSKLEQPTARQVALLRRVYRGREPRTLSRYGVKQWSAALPWVTTVVKDPFALIAVPTVVRVTSAVPVIVFRHPGAVLASYRRMGWTAGIGEIRRLDGLPAGAEPKDDVAAMAEFWTWMHRQVLSWVDDVPGCLLVDHAEFSLAGAAGLAALRSAVGLQPARERAATESATSAALAAAAPDAGGLHRFDRAPEEVAHGWRARLAPAETDLLDSVTTETYLALHRRRFRST